MAEFDLSEEIWTVIVEAPDYEVSDQGRVRRLTRKFGASQGLILKQHLDIYGYPALHLRTPDGQQLRRKVHRIVCEAFHGPCPPGKRDVAHFDGVRSNNCASNLRWATRAENMADMLRHGTANPRRGSSSPNAKLTEEDVLVIRAAPRRRGILYELAARYGVSRNVVGNIRTKSSPCWNHIRHHHPPTSRAS